MYKLFTKSILLYMRMYFKKHFVELFQYKYFSFQKADTQIL